MLDQKFWGILTVRNIFGPNLQSADEDLKSYFNRVRLDKADLEDTFYWGKSIFMLLTSILSFAASMIAVGMAIYGTMALGHAALIVASSIMTMICIASLSVCRNIIDALRFANSVTNIIAFNYLNVLGLKAANAEIKSLDHEPTKQEKEEIVKAAIKRIHDDYVAEAAKYSK